MSKSRWTYCAVQAVIFSALLSEQAFAYQSDTGRGLPSDSMVGDDLLDSVRGGFDLGNGFNISFGIERAVYINGTLVTNTGFYLNDISSLQSPMQLQSVVGKGVIESHSFAINDNASIAALTKLSEPLIIQNAVSGQSLKAVTTITAIVPSLLGLRSINLGETLQNALGNSLSTR